MPTFDGVWDSGAMAKLLAFSGAYWAVALASRRAACALAWVVGVAATVWSTGWLAPLAATVFALACLNLGEALVRGLSRALAFCVGLAAYTALFEVTAFWPVNHPWLWTALLLIPIGWQRRWPPLPSPVDWGGTALTWVALILLGAALAPEVSIDGLSMHLYVPAYVAQHAQWHFDAARQAWAVQPLGGDGIHTIAYLLGGEMAARLMNWILGVMLATVAVDGLRTRLPLAFARGWAAVLLASPILLLTTANLFVENAWILFVTAAFATVRRSAFASGLLLGAACATKLFAFAAWPLLLAVAFARWWHLLPGAAVAAVPLVVAWWRTGNPVFPRWNHIVASPLFDASQSFVDPAFIRAIEWRTLWDLSFHTSWFLEGRDGGFAWQWLIIVLWPVARWGRLSADARRWWLLGSILFVAIFSVQSNARYVAVCLPLFTLAAAGTLRARGLIAGLLLLNVAYGPASGGWQRQWFVAPPERDAYVRQLAPQRELVQLANQQRRGDSVAFLLGEECAGLAAKPFTNSWHTPFFQQRLIQTRSAAGFAQLFRDAGVQLVIAPAPGHPDWLEHSALSRYLQRHTRTLGTRGALQLAEVVDGPIERVPPLTPGEYDDADYRIEYQGDWYLDRQFTASRHRTLSYARRGSFRVEFEGRRITWVFTRAANRGRARIEVDGVTAAQVDLHDAGLHWQQGWTSPVLPPGRHTLQVTLLTPGRYLDVDALVVE
jgi:hypothetical protein